MGDFSAVDQILDRSSESVLSPERRVGPVEPELLGPERDSHTVAHTEAGAANDDESSSPALHHPAGAAALGGGARQQVRLPDELRDERRTRPPVHLGGRAELDDAAAIHHGQPVAHGERFLLVVGDIDEGGAELAVQRLELELHRLAELEIERAERLIEQQDLGTQHQRAGQCHPLPLPARELSRAPRAEPTGVEADQCKSVGHPSANLVPRKVPLLQPEGDVAEDRHVGEERIALEDHPDRPLVGTALVHHLPGDGHRAGIGRLEAGEEPEGRRLAAAGGAEQREELPARNREGNAVHRGDGPEPADETAAVHQRRSGGRCN